MPSTPKVDKKQPKKSKNGGETPVVPEKRGKKSKTPKDEARRTEEEDSPPKKTKKKEEKRKVAGGDGSVLKLGGLAPGLKESSKPTKKPQNQDGTILDPSKTASRPVKRIPTAETSKNTSGPSRSSKLVDAHEADVLNQRKRSRGDGEPTASTGTLAKKLKLNDGGAAAALSKTKEPSATGRKNSSVKEEIMLEDSSDEDVESEDHIHGFSTDGDSSDDDDAMVADVPAMDVSKLPTVAKDDITVQKRLQKAKSKPTADRGVLYIGRIPHGFYEDQMKEYFSQFGNVTRLRMARNKKTGRSKHYGFIEFDSSSVAQIVSETMNNYLIMGHLLQCEVIPKDKVHPDLWVGANRRWRKVPANRVARLHHNKPRTEEQRARADKKLLKRQEERVQRLKDHGIEYSFGRAAYTPVGA